MSGDNRAIQHPQSQIVLIVAMAHERVIGKDGRLPWHLPADLKRFKALTVGHPVIMGRKTYDSIGRALPGRHNIVVSRDAKLSVKDADCATSLRSALELAGSAGRVFVIGGEQIYRLALPLADCIELTEVDTTVAGDACFPQIDANQWREQRRESHNDPASGLRYDFVTLQRIRR